MIEHEVIPPRAADGRPLVPAASTFGEFMRFLEDGRLDSALVDQLREIVAAMRDHATSTNGKAKAKLTLVLEFSLESEAFFITAKYAAKLPDEQRPRSITWATADGRFTRTVPNQHQLFGVQPVR